MKNLLKKIFFTASIVLMSIENFAASSSGNIGDWEPFINLTLINKTGTGHAIGNFTVYFEEKESKGGSQKKIIERFTFEPLDEKVAHTDCGSGLLDNDHIRKLTGVELIRGVMDSAHRTKDGHDAQAFKYAKQKLKSFFERYSAFFSFYIKDERGSHQVITPLEAKPHERFTYHIKKSDQGSYFLSAGPDDGIGTSAGCPNVNILSRN